MRKIKISKPGKFLIEDEEHELNKENINPKKPSLEYKNIDDDKKDENNNDGHIEPKTGDEKKVKKKVIKKKKKKPQKIGNSMSSYELTNLYKMLDENVAKEEKEKDELNLTTTTKSNLKENANLIDLKINLDKNFQIKDLYTYDKSYK